MAQPPPSLPPQAPPLAGLVAWCQAPLVGRTLDELLWLEAQGRWYQQQYTVRQINNPPAWLLNQIAAISKAVDQALGL